MSDPQQTYWLGIDLGGTKILAEVFDSEWKCVGSEKAKTKAEEGQEATLARLLKAGQTALAAAGIPPGKLGGVGIGVPGVLDPRSGLLIQAPNLGWKNLNLAELLSKTFGAPAHVANDVDAGAYGEAVLGAGKGARCVLGVFPGTGIGGGLVVDNEIFCGSNRSCMEIGHIQALPNGPRCGCGRQGCLEAIAGRLAISAAASAAVLRGQAPWLLANAGSDPAKIRSGMLAKAIENGDTAVRDIVEQACDALGGVLGDMVNLLAPDVIVIGGGLAEALPELYGKRVEKAMRPRVMKALEDVCKIRIAKLGDHATSLGSAAWARHQTEKKT